MTAAPPAPTARARRLAGYLFALAAGAIWGTTGPLSTALYRAGEAITGIGFWRLVIGLLGFLAYGLFRPQLFRIDRKAWLLVGLGGGALVALFEVAYQFGIAGTGVAGAAALLYIAPVLVAILAKPLLGEQLTALRIVLAFVVMAGAALTVQGGSHSAGAGGAGGAAAIPLPSLIQGVAGGLLAMLSFAGTTLLARYAVPRYGATQVLFLEILGGIVVLAIVLPSTGHTPLPPLPPQVSDTSPFRRLALPAPNEMREGSGRPGPRYWQQRADYTIRATLDTATHTIAGSETLR